jgi:FSR family fosmidomycin resistance protein-like MFS transporter
VVVAAGHAAHDTYTAFLPPLLPLLIASLALSKTEAGMLAVILQAPWLMQPVIGHLSDRLGAQKLLVWAPAVSAVGMCLLGTAPSYAALTLLLLLAGISSAVFHALGPAMVSAVSGRALGRGMGFWMVGGELGRTLGPVVVVAAVEAFTLGGLPWVMVGGLAASVVLYVQLGRKPSPALAVRQRLPIREVLRALGPLMLPLGGIMLLRSFLVAALNLYLPLFLSEQGAQLWLAGISLAVLEAAGVAGALLGGIISDRIGRRAVLATSLLATPLAMLLFLGSRGAAQLALLVLLGVTGFSVTPVIMALVQEGFPGNRALANGVYMFLSYLIRSLAVVGLGAGSDFAGLHQAYTLSALIALLGLPLVFFLPRATEAPP